MYLMSMKARMHIFTILGTKYNKIYFIIKR